MPTIPSFKKSYNNPKANKSKLEKIPRKQMKLQKYTEKFLQKS